MPLPPLVDVAYWRPIIESGRWEGIADEDLVAAFLARGSSCTRRIANGVAARLLKQASRILRSNVSRSHRNGGDDIVEDALHVAMAALLEPDSRYAAGLATNFKVRLRFGALSAVGRAMVREKRRADPDDDFIDNVPSEVDDPLPEAKRRRLMDAMDDPLVKQMLHEYLEGFTYAEIAERRGIGESTVRDQIRNAIARIGKPKRKGNPS